MTESNLLSTGLKPTARGRNIALYVSNHEEQFDRLSGMTFAVVFYTGNKNAFVQRSKSTPEPRRRQFFFNLRFFSAYLVHIDSPNRGHEYIVSTPKYTIKAFILEMIAKNILLNDRNNNKIKKYCQYYFVT